MTEPAPDADYPLLPLQHLYLALPKPEAFFMESVTFELDPSVEPTHLEEIAHALVQQHDALRTCFLRDPSTGVWRQRFLPADVRIQETISWFDLSELPIEHRMRAIPQVLTKMADSLRLERGGLYRMILFEPGGDRKRLLAIVAHHALLDLMSSRILFAGLKEGVDQLARGQSLSLAPPTDSVGDWSRTLAGLGADEAFTKRAPAWEQDLRDCTAPILPRIEQPPRAFGFTLTEAETDALRRQATMAYRAPFDVLLAVSASQAIARWQNSTRASFGWLQSGRTPVPAGTNLTRTAGLLVCLAPLSVAVNPGAPAKDRVASFKAQHPQIAQHALDYTVLTHYGPDQSLGARLLAHPALQIRVNYTGDADYDARRSEKLTLGPILALGHAANARNNPTMCPINIVFRINKAQLMCKFVCFGIDVAQVRPLGDLLAESLRGLL